MTDASAKGWCHWHMSMSKTRDKRMSLMLRHFVFCHWSNDTQSCTGCLTTQVWWGNNWYSERLICHIRETMVTKLLFLLHCTIILNTGIRNNKKLNHLHLPTNIYTIDYKSLELTMGQLICLLDINLQHNRSLN